MQFWLVAAAARCPRTALVQQSFFQLSGALHCVGIVGQAHTKGLEKERVREAKKRRCTAQHDIIVRRASVVRQVNVLKNDFVSL